MTRHHGEMVGGFLYERPKIQRGRSASKLVEGCVENPATWMFFWGSIQMNDDSGLLCCYIMRE